MLATQKEIMQKTDQWSVRTALPFRQGMDRFLRQTWQVSGNLP